MRKTKKLFVRNPHSFRLSVFALTVLLFLAATTNIGATSIKKITKLASKCQNGSQKSCLKLAQIAKSDKDWQARRSAVKKLNDQELLCEIAKRDTKSKVRQAAVEMITEQAVLVDIAKNDTDRYVRIAALEKLTDQLVIAEIARSDNSNAVRKKAIEMTTDQTLLFEIAKSDINNCSDILEKLSDQEYILYIAKNSDNIDLRESATNKLKDPQAIMEIVKVERDWHAKVNALWKIKDESILALIAKDRIPTSLDIENGKLELLPGETVKTEIRTGLMQEIYAQRSLKDKKVLDKITINPGKIEYMEKTITDLPTFACLRISDEKLLCDIAKNAVRVEVRILAIERIADRSVLLEISNKDKDNNVRVAAKQRLKQI